MKLGFAWAAPALDWFRQASKRKKFAALLGVMALLGVLLSMAAKITFVPKDSASSYRVAVAGPLSGPSAEIGRSLRQGAQFLVENLNKAGGIDGRTIVLDFHDDKGDPAEAARIAQTIAAQPAVLAVVGHWSGDVAEAAAAIYRDAGIPLVAPSAGWPDLTHKDGWVFSPLFDAKAESRFLSNYARNVMGHKLMSMVVEDTPYGRAMADAFVETFQRFGAPPQFRFTFTPGDPAAIKKLVDDYKAKRDEAGALFLAADEANAPAVVKAFKDANLRPMWFGPSRLGTNAFTNAFGPLGQNYTNGIYVSSPLLFDTANEAAQGFKGAYRQRFDTEPDWVAAYAHDAVKMVAETLRGEAIAGGTGNLAERRLKLRNALAQRLKPEDGVRGVTGVTSFQENGRSTTPVLMGIYNGENLISALTQLQPIPQGAVSNYIEELRQGRVLYVNDRFMYKTNVVYVGLQVKEIGEFDLEKETAVLDLAVWVRYRGDFKPQDLSFANAADEIKLGDPAEEGVIGDMAYRLYRFKGKFNMNFSGAPRSYGSHIVGVSFRHKSLNRNNLLYVVDVLGMPSGQKLKERLVKDKVIPAGMGWEVDRAWVSQEVAEEDALGDPKYVGHGAITPDFSKIDLGIVIKKSTLSARDVVPTEWFIYFAAFGLVAVIFAQAMDTKQWGRFWYLQSYGLRVVFWPLLLLAGGNLVLDYAYQNLTLAEVWLAVTAYDILWWVMPARLVTMAISRFAWTPLEERTGRAIPNVVRGFVSFLVHAFAFLGILAFVLNQPITSVLAGSGLLAMIVGLAIQANLSNIFSGIVLNMERPFTVGDWVKIGSAEDGKVTDITWRTTRLLTRTGMTIAIPNAKASESQIVNYSLLGRARMNISLYVDPSIPTEKMRKTLRDAPLNVPGVLTDPGPGVYFDGIVSADGGWLAQYSVQYWIADYAGKTAVSGRVWDELYSRLKEAGIALGSGLGAKSGAAFAAMEKEGEAAGLLEKPEWEFVQNEFQDEAAALARIAD